ncbi:MULTISPECIES: dimethylarginine dimethylaminohydrolase family protein [unclassified Robiginitalea]|uniref:dimethylarginine dimethylaminohydrolase family protein n=1 Tax=Robiginitalea TaxID=252306 RepID=UPI002349566E|nr:MULTISPECIES: arginine deiminase family protein [unclassified Robiginitalea]MDC6355476.1 arginine deiminase family protein [Robiginitalea sp. PM2]MDC6375914.1 arginine deiminase family protein [Robiginitalea sp. SP8]
MLNLNIADETARLRAVVLGTAADSGPVPDPAEAYDPKSLQHILAGTYPEEADMVREMDGFEAVLKKHGARVFRPENIPGCNQIFSRDIAFVVDDKMVEANILPEREREFEAIVHVLDKLGPSQLLVPPEEVHVEGGDVMPWKEFLFVGTYTARDYPGYITARTNREAVEYLREAFPNREVKSFELRKHNTDPRLNALHLDCCFQPVGHNLAILHRESFIHARDYEWLRSYFGPENVFEITTEEMYRMFSNVFSISPEVVVSEQSFTRLNAWLESRGLQVETIPYNEVGKQGGLLRCSTLPLAREPG